MSDFTRLFFYNEFFCTKIKEEHIIQKIEKYAEENDAIVKKNAAKWFIKDLKKYWDNCSRVRNVFERKYSNWLKTNLYEKRVHLKEIVTPTSTKSFASLSVSQKRRRTAELRQRSSSSLVFATTSSLKKAGKSETAAVLQAAVQAPEKNKIILKEYKQSVFKEMNVNKALAIFLDCQLTKSQYLRLRFNTLDQATNRFPSYTKLSVAKSKCYPDNKIIDERSVTVPLQDLLDHTAQRLILSLDDEINRPYILHHKWGFDGCSGHAEYKQKEAEDASFCTSIFTTAIVPLRLTDATNMTVVWTNPTPSSTWHCRPLRMSFIQETIENVKIEHDRVQQQITKLVPTKVQLKETQIMIHHELHLTMLDGKCINILEDNTASSRCYICKAGPKDLNSISFAKSKTVSANDSCFTYGLSPLHARIKFFEYLLHLSYRLPLPDEAKYKGCKLSEHQKKIVQERKKDIQDQMKAQLGLLVDTPKQGFGSSNDGNTARKFFDAPDVSAEILQIDKVLIKRFAVIINAINVSAYLDPDKFDKYAKDTAELLLRKYSFWTMTPTVHKVLLHGRQVIEQSILPIGMLSEEAIEHRHKDIKLYRNQYARKTSRVENLTDIFNRCQLTSDPYIRQLRAWKKPNKKQLPVEVKFLLKNIDQNDSDTDSSDDDC